MKKHILSLGLMLGLALVLSVPANATLLGLSQLSQGGCEGPACTIPTAMSNTTQSASAVIDTFAQSNLGTGCAADTRGNPSVNGLGTLVADTCVQQRSDFTPGGSPVITTQFREAVYKETGGTLDFYYQIHVSSNAAGYNLLDLFALPFNYGGPTYVGTAGNVALLGDGTGNPSVTDTPTKVTEGVGGIANASCNNVSNGCVVWTFGSGFRQGDTSLTLVVSTTATNYQADLLGFEGTNGASAMDPIVGFAPVAVTPEPVSIILTGTVLGFTALLVRRRRSRKNNLSVS